MLKILKIYREIILEEENPTKFYSLPPCQIGLKLSAVGLKWYQNHGGNLESGSAQPSVYFDKMPNFFVIFPIFKRGLLIVIKSSHDD